MTLTRTHLILAATLASFGIMLGAWGFQYIGDMAPCKLCLWQRYPHLAAIGIGIVVLATRQYWLAWAGAVAAVTTAGIGGYHTGVERGWWEGLASCSSQSIEGLSTDELLEQIMSAPLVRCDEVPWELFTLSMASWNMIASLGFAALWVMAARMR